jgi:hypothetical protein
MNIRLLTTPAISIRNLARALFDKLTQHPEYYNIKHYTKSKARNRNRQGAW